MEAAFHQLSSQLQAQQQQMDLLIAVNQQMASQLHNMQQQEQKNTTQVIASSPQPGDPTHRDIRPSTFAPVKPDTFNGSRRTAADVWIFNLEQYFKATGIINDSQRVNFAAAQLRDSATTWWRKVNQQADKGLAPKTWEEFAKAFETQFTPVAMKDSARASLHAMKQRSSVAGYCDAFTNCLLQLGADDVSEGDQLFLFKRGLNKDIAQQINIARPKNLGDTMALAVQIEIENRNYSRGSTGSGHGHGQPFRHSHSGPPSRANNNSSSPMELGQIDRDYGNDSDLDHENKYAEVDEHEPANINAATMGRRLTPEQVKDHMRRGVCFTCGRAGHLSRNCPERTRKLDGLKPSAQYHGHSKK
jgi:hypothetical protein